MTPKVDATISHELYVFHRWGLIRYGFELKVNGAVVTNLNTDLLCCHFRTINVRPAVSSDFAGIQNIVVNVSGSDVILRYKYHWNMIKNDIVNITLHRTEGVSLTPVR